MPTYDYLCKNCGHRFEIFQKISHDPAGECPACASNRVERLLTGGAGVIFKGSGFYHTDYKKKPQKKKQKTEKKEKK